MRIVIVEDEPLLAKKLQKMVLELEPEAEIEAITNSIASTVKWLQLNGCPDLFLMDIELADGQSFEIFRQVEIKCPIIFTTAYDEFALKAFKVSSIDYLLKPIKAEELGAAINKFHSLAKANAANANLQLNSLLHALQKMPSSKTFRDRFLVKQGQKSISVPIYEIALFFTEKGVNYLLTEGKRKYIVDYTLDEIEKSVDPDKFFRANRQFILSSKAAIAVLPWFNGKLKIETEPAYEEHIIISREKANDFRKWMGE